jgi:hypothetical protein
MSAMRVGSITLRSRSGSHASICNPARVGDHKRRGLSATGQSAAATFPTQAPGTPRAEPWRRRARRRHISSGCHVGTRQCIASSLDTRVRIRLALSSGATAIAANPSALPAPWSSTVGSTGTTTAARPLYRPVIYEAHVLAGKGAPALYFLSALRSQVGTTTHARLTTRPAP